MPSRVAPPRVGVALPLVAVHAPHLRTPPQTQGERAAVVGGRSMMQGPSHARNVLGHHGRIGAEAAPGQHQLRGLNHAQRAVQFKAGGAALHRCRGGQPLNRRRGPDRLPKPGVQGCARGGLDAVKAPLAVAGGHHVSQVANGRGTTLEQKGTGLRQGLSHRLGDVLIDHARRKLPQVDQPGLGTFVDACGRLQGRAGRRKQPAADGQVVGRVGHGLKQRHTQAPGLRSQRHKHAGRTGTQNREIGLQAFIAPRYWRS